MSFVHPIASSHAEADLQHSLGTETLNLQASSSETDNENQSQLEMEIRDKEPSSAMQLEHPVPSSVENGLLDFIVSLI